MRTKYITPDEVARIAADLKGHSRVIWLLMVDTGLRISDAVKLKYSDIDDKGQIHYKSKKTGKNGIAVPSGTVLALLGRKVGSEYIFRSVKNPKKHIHRSTVFRHIKEACKKCGINADGIAPHSARKAFAVKDFRQNGLGKTMLDLQHSSPATTLFYALSDDPIPQIFSEIERIKGRVDDLFEICDTLHGLIVDIDAPCDVKLTKKGD
ncbi:MAG: tyrosine-type recombinase/integrase [Clostridia bacterium]|nr:tyrosine-type recombinase/integrase [Clostridia bacterium]